MNFKTGIGKQILEDLRQHKITKPMNSPWDAVQSGKSDGKSVWINPHNQFCFNAMHCSPEVILLWMEGKGPMVKGKTLEVKKKYWEYAIFESTDDPWEINHSTYLIKYKWKWFERMTTDFNPHNHKGCRLCESEIRKPLKLRANRTRDLLENKIRTEKAIIDMLAPYVDYIVKEFEYRKWQEIQREVENDLYGIKRTLYCLGYGYMGACNTPEEISNLSWVPGVVYAKGIYLWLKKQNYELLPDFEFLTHPDRDKWNWDDNEVI